MVVVKHQIKVAPSQKMKILHVHTLKSRINQQTGISEQGGTFLKFIKRAGRNKRAGGTFLLNLINQQARINEQGRN